MVQSNSFNAIWSKYLPVIRILLKKALTAEQTLNLNVSDFERAGMARKTGYKFFIKLVNCKVDNVIVDSPLASNLASMLLENEAIRELCSNREFHISMNAKFQLSIKHVPQPELVSHEND